MSGRPEFRPRAGAEAVAANLAEGPPLSAQEARLEAARCLYCFDAPCIHACPTGIDVPGFIKKIASGRLRGAARTIYAANVLGASCARVCPTAELCEGACVLLDRDQQPIEIGRLQRYATDYANAHGMPLVESQAAPSGKRVALVGGGPASLACAAELARLGHHAVIYERSEHAGGLNTYGVAYYKMPPEVSLLEVRQIEALGVEIRTGVEVGRAVSVSDLRREYDAVFFGVGLGRTHALGIPGEDLPEVVEALAFIRRLRTEPLGSVPVGRRVAVIGCGNTAIDAVTQALRVGAETAVIVYRRAADAMTAYPFEYELAKSDGAEFIFNAAPIAVLGDDHVRALQLVRTQIGAAGNVEPVPGSEFELPVDMVIKALGQERQRALLLGLLPELELDADGVIVRDFATGRTNVAGVYAGGDAANGGSEVVDAVADGRRAARGIHEQLAGHRESGPVQTTRLGVASVASGAGLDAPVRVRELEAQYEDRRRRG
ncbi:MAG: NAD(P)-dependent oxidoreductase [Planctomycetota bacterium]